MRHEYDLPDLEDWLAYQRPVVILPAVVKAKANGSDRSEENPYLEYTRRLGWKPPVDVDNALAAMSYMADGDRGIHQTQVRVTAALAARGELTDDQITDLVLAATQAAAGHHGATWNWRREERAIRNMVATARNKWDKPEPQPQPELEEERPTGPFTPVWEMEVGKARKWLVHELLGVGGLSVMYGAPGSGKSFLAIDLAMRIAAGLPFQGRQTKQGTVVYIAAEAGQGIVNRILAFTAEYMDSNRQVPLYALAEPVDLFEPRTSDMRRMVDYIGNMAGDHVAMIVIDTLARTLGGGDENSGQDMGAIIRNVDQLRADTHAEHTLVIHHSGKDKARGSRGHSSLLAAVDTEIEIEHSELTNQRTAKITKQRDGETGDPIVFQLKQYSFGMNEHYEEIKTCVVTNAEQYERPITVKLSDRQTLVMQVIRNYFIDLPDEEYLSFDLLADLLERAGIELTKQKRANVREQLAAKGLIRLERRKLALLRRGRQYCPTTSVMGNPAAHSNGATDPTEPQQETVEDTKYDEIITQF